MHTESDVTLLIAPYCEGVPVGNEDPLPDIKLALFHYKRVLDALLNDPEPSISLQEVDSIYYSVICLVNFNSATPATAAGLEKP